MKFGTVVCVLMGLMFSLSAEQLEPELKLNDNTRKMKHKTAHVIHEKESELSKWGVFEAEIGSYWEAADTHDSSERSQLGNLNLTLHYISPEWNSFSLELAGLYNGKLRDKDEVYDGVYQKETIISEAFLKWEDKDFSIHVGRMPLHYVLLDDYFEGVSFITTLFDDVEVRAAWVKNSAALDPDEVTDFEKLNGSDGLFGLEVDFKLCEASTLTLVEYYAHDLNNQFGIRFSSEIEGSELANSFVAEAYYVENFQEDVKDGYVLHIGDSITFNELFSVGGGVIKTSKSGGAGGLWNNPYDPFDEDTLEEYADAEAWYLTAGVQLTEQLTLDFVYGHKTFVDGGIHEKVKEFDATLGYSFTSDFAIEVAYVNYLADKGDDWDKVWTYINYTF